MKKVLSIIISMSVLCSLFLTGCSLNSKLGILSLTDTTVVASVDKIDGKTLTLTLGSLSSGGMGNSNGNPPEMPSGNSDANNANTPPQKPSDNSDNSNGNSSDKTSTDSNPNNGGTPPEMPSGDSNGQMPSGMGGSSSFQKGNTVATLVIKNENLIYQSENNEKESAKLSDIKEGSIIEIAIDKKSNITSLTILDVSSSSSGMGGNSQAPTDYSSVKKYEKDDTVSDDTIKSTGTDENAVLVTNSATVTFKNVVLSRVSSESKGGDSSSFYGIGAALLVIDGNAYVNGGKITTDAAGGAGAFAYNTGKVYIAGTEIDTDKDASGGIHVAGGGTLYAWDLKVNTNGNSAAAIRSDRGGGKMVVDGGTYTSNGTGSPAVYCTADIAVNKSTLTATNSEAICIEGKNTLHLYDCNLSGNMQDNEQNDTTWTIIVYQSMSGDSEVGNSTFSMVGGTLTSGNGGLIYTTNTESHILLDSVNISQSKDSEFFLQCTGNQNKRGWGTVGKNGSDCTFTGINQAMNGNVIWDSVSNLNFYMTNGSTLTGAVIDDETNAGNGGDGSCSLYIDSNSTWIVTANSTLTNLYSSGTIKDSSGKVVKIVGTDGKVIVDGNSEYTITVSDFSKTVDMSKADTATSFKDYQQTKPSELS